MDEKLRQFRDALIVERVASKFAGDVVPLKLKPGVPTVLIGGRKYVLSTDGGPLGDREDDDSLADDPRIIRGPQTTKWKYLWAYDVERQFVAMWRVSDGNEKQYGPARTEQARIIKLDKKGQLNRVTHDEMRKIETEMRKREHDAMKAMTKYVEDNKPDTTKNMDKLVEKFFERFVEPKLNRALNDVERGVIPAGFEPHGPGETDPAWRLRQMSSYVLGQVFQREMPLAKVEDFLRENGVDVEAEGQWVEWAIGDVRDKAVEVFLPPRP